MFICLIASVRKDPTTKSSAPLHVICSPKICALRFFKFFAFYAPLSEVRQNQRTKIKPRIQAVTEQSVLWCGIVAISDNR